MRLMLVVFAIAALLTPIAAEAQHLDSRTLSWARTNGRPILPTELVQPDDYRLEGAILGGVFFAVAGGWALHEACKTQPVPIEPGQNRSCTGSTAGGAAVGAALGAGLGYVAGRLTHRR